MGISVFTEFPDEEYTVIIDAVFGVGLCREITGHYKDVIDWMNLQDAEKVAVDIPSGICAATGQILGTAFHADLTVCMACVKLGCELFPGKSCAGESIPVAIGIDPEYFSNRLDVCYTFDKNELEKLLPERTMNSHKGSYGKVLMITGSPGMAAAAREAHTLVIYSRCRSCTDLYSKRKPSGTAGTSSGGDHFLL
mgnify:CR=1 FL=1